MRAAGSVPSSPCFSLSVCDNSLTSSSSHAVPARGPPPGGLPLPGQHGPGPGGCGGEPQGWVRGGGALGPPQFERQPPPLLALQNAGLLSIVAMPGVGLSDGWKSVGYGECRRRRPAPPSAAPAAAQSHALPCAPSLPAALVNPHPRPPPLQTPTGIVEFAPRDTLRKRNGSASSLSASVVPWGNFQLQSDLPFTGLRCVGHP